MFASLLLLVMGVVHAPPPQSTPIPSAGEASALPLAVSAEPPSSQTAPGIQPLLAPENRTKPVPDAANSQPAASVSPSLEPIQPNARRGPHVTGAQQAIIDPDASTSPPVVGEWINGERVVSNSAVDSTNNEPSKELGVARLHLHVPSGAYITINDQPTRNRDWNKHRHFKISDIGPNGKLVKVEVGIRQENRKCNDLDHCKSDGDVDCHCGHELKTCCKQVTLRPGDEEYLSFATLSLQPNESELPTLSFEVLSKKAFPENLRSSSIATEVSNPAATLTETAPAEKRFVKRTRIVDTTTTYNATAKIEHVVETVTATHFVPGQPADKETSHAKDTRITTPLHPTPHPMAGTETHTREEWSESNVELTTAI